MIKAVFFDLGDTLISEESVGKRRLPEATLEKVAYADKILGLLKNKYKLGVVTNTRTSRELEVREALRKIGIEHYFDVVVTSVDVGFEKPSERIFHVALEALSVKPEEAVMVGNRVSRDILGGNKIGMKTILFRWNNRHNEEITSALEQPNILIHSLKELQQALSHINKG